MSPEKQNNHIEPPTPEQNDPDLNPHELENHELSPQERARAEQRLEKAEEKVEKWDRKEKLYHGMGKVALSSDPEQEAELWPKPENFLERLGGLIIDRRSRKKIEADNNAYRTKSIYGEDSASHTPSVRKAAFDTVAKPTGRVNDTESGVLEAVVDNGERLIVGPDIPGHTRLRQIFDRAGNRIKFIFGNRSAREARIEAGNIKAAPTKIGNRAHKQTRRQARRRDESFRMSVGQPVRSSWRTFWRNRAEKKAQRERNILGIDTPNNYSSVIDIAKSMGRSDLEGLGWSTAVGKSDGTRYEVLEHEESQYGHPYFRIRCSTGPERGSLNKVETLWIDEHELKKLLDETDTEGKQGVSFGFKDKDDDSE